MIKRVTINYIITLMIAMAIVTAAGCESPSGVGVIKDPVTWLERHAIQLNSIDPADENFNDLKPLREVLDGVRVVLLGEETHYDGAAFFSKTRLIKYLHQECGFDVLAFESGLYDCWKAWQFLQAGEDPVTACRRGIFGIWSNTSQLRPLMEYLGEEAQGGDPLELAGVDCQFTGSASRDFLLDDLASYLSNANSTITERSDWTDFIALFDKFIHYEFSDTPPTSEEKVIFSEVLSALQTELDGIEKRSATSEAIFWAQLFRSYRAMAEREGLLPREDPSVDIDYVRDIQMGRNLVWMAETLYPDRKIIVWAATFHIMHNPSLIDTRMTDLSYENAVTMGHVAWQSLGTELYAMGFTAWAGIANRELPVSSEGSLEDLLERAGLVNAIVDLRSPPTGGGWLSESMISRPLGYREMEADWTQVLDGMFFNRIMTPSSYAPGSIKIGHLPPQLNSVSGPK